jgi:bile acid:Na+ symporter, BASS family
MNKTMSILDGVRLNFSEGGLLFMNLTLALIMFGVALEIDVHKFKAVILKPKPVIIGLIAQYLMLPLITFLMALLIRPTASIALGMILVASCPSGNIANFLTWMAKGNVELSITLNAIASLLAIFLTPLNFSFYGNLYNEAQHIMVPISIDGWQMLKTVFLLLGLPLILGTLFSWRFTSLARKITKPMKTISLIVFVGFIVAALSANFSYFLRYIHLIILLVLLQNAVVIMVGYLLARFAKLELSNIKTITIESGIHNSGLALVLIFNPKLFNGLGGMAFIAAWWGIWHIIVGLGLAHYFSKKIA